MSIFTKDRRIWWANKSQWLIDFDEDQNRKNRDQFKNMAFSEDNLKGFVLALLSSLFIGSSFIIKKKGLRRAAAASGVRAGIYICILFYILLSCLGFFYWDFSFLNWVCFFFSLDLFCRSWWFYLSLWASLVGWHGNK